MEYAYLEEHAILEKAYLDRGSRVREELVQAKLSPEEFDHALNLQLDYAYARLPFEFWSDKVPPRIPRSLLKEVNDYAVKSPTMFKSGLGLSLISNRFNSKLSALYYLCGKLVRRHYKCFTITYSQLSYFFRESKDNALLKSELMERFKVDFFFLLDIPELDDLPSYIRQDLFASLELRFTSEKPVLLSANTSVSTLNELVPDSILGRILGPFASANKLIRVEDNTDLDTLYEDKWEASNVIN